eukprot:COSAG05_NODE_5675_length_1118_cov_0.996075_1_plen_219_part_10
MLYLWRASCIIFFLGSGACFGDLGVLSDCRRSLTLRAATDCKVMSIDAWSFKQALQEEAPWLLATLTAAALAAIADSQNQSSGAACNGSGGSDKQQQPVIYGGLKTSGMISGGGSGQQPQYASGDKVKRVLVDPSVALKARTESALPVGSSLLPRQQRSNYQQQQQEQQQQEREQHMPSALGMLTSAGGRRLSSPPHEIGPIATTLLTATVEGGNNSGL